MTIQKFDAYSLACDGCGANGSEEYTGGDYQAWTTDPSEWESMLRDMDWTSFVEDGRVKHHCEECALKALDPEGAEAS